MSDFSPGTTAARISILFLGGCWAQLQLHAVIKNISTRSISMELQAGDLKTLMADYSTTAGDIPILHPVGCWAQRQLHASIRHVSVASKLMKSLSSVRGLGIVVMAEFHAMADSSTTGRGIPILIAGGCWA